MSTTFVKGKPLWRTSNTVKIALLSAFFTAIYKTMDNITVHNYIVAPDGLTAAFAYLTIGGWIGVIFGIIFSLALGRKLDPDFKRVVFNNSQMHKRALICGFVGAIQTLFLLWGNQLGDPSMIIAMGSGVMLYTACYDLITKQTNIKQILLPTIVVILGSMMTTYGGSLAITALGFLFVVVIANGFEAAGEIYSQQGVRKSDSINFFLWRFFWIATIGTILAITVSAIRGMFPLYIQTMVSGIPYGIFIALTMFFVFLGIGLSFVAKKNDAITKVLIGRSPQIVLGFVFTWIGNWIFPGLFGSIPGNLIVWIVRAIGAILLVWGIYILLKKSKQEEN